MKLNEAYFALTSTVISSGIDTVIINCLVFKALAFTMGTGTTPAHLLRPRLSARFVAKPVRNFVGGSGWN